MSNRFAGAHIAGLVQLIHILLFLIVDGWSCAMAQTPTLQVQHLMRPQSVQVRTFEALASRLEKEQIAHLVVGASDRSDDGARRLTEAVRNGAVDLAVVPLAALGDRVPRFRVFEIPFLFRDERHAVGAQFDGKFQLLEELRPAGFVGVGWWPGETLILASREPVLEPSDVRGLRIATLSLRESGEASALRLLGEKTGALPRDLPRTLILPDLQVGAIDVIEAELTELNRLKPPKLSVTLTNHLYSGYVVIANPARWAKLPNGVGDRLRRELERAHDAALSELSDAVATARLELAQEWGASFFPVPPAVGKDWRDALRSESLAGPAGYSFVDAVEKHRFGFAKAPPGRGPTISWNVWFEAGTASKPKEVHVFEVNGVYRLNLDLARYPYRQVWSARLGQPIETLLGGQGERSLLLQPVLLGDQLAAAPGRPLRAQELTVRLEKAKAGPKDEALLEAFGKKQLTTRALSREVNLGGFVSWDIKAEAVGCGGVAFTVWDQARVTPLDHIVLQIPVHEGGKGTGKCEWQDTAKSMNAGLLTMLAGSAPAAGARAPDAALQVFESQDGGKRRSQAVFVHRERLLAALADPKTSDPGVYSWQLASALSTYVSDSSQMPELIKAAHKAIAQPSKQPFPFADVAGELAVKIFSGSSSRDRGEADKARAALRSVVDTAPEPTVVMRLISADGETLFVPLGLLAAQAEKPEVSKRFTVIQPLPHPRPVSSPCIGSWRVARPTELQGVSGDARDLLRSAAGAPPAAGISVIDTHASLVKFLAGNEGVVKDRGDGLIVLAHHDRGYLKFNDTDRPPARVAREYIKRDFQPGSVAILAACTTTGDLAETRAITDQLAQQGVDALIVAPFAVDAEFGTRLALEFEKVVAAERAKSNGATLLQIFERTAANVASIYKNHAALRDMALEFMLIGNPDIKLCQ